MPTDGHLWLIGMMGAGKTTVGRILARRMDRPFIDVDDVIVTVAGKTVAEIFATDGEMAFRRLERDAVTRIAAGPHAVVATGGGAVLEPANVETMRRTGTVILLDARPTTLAGRVGSTGRPLLADGDTEELLAGILDARATRYATAAHGAVPTDELAPEAIADRIEERWTAS